MARGPDGETYAAELDAEAEGFNRMEFELTLGLEKIIDRMMDSHRRGDSFVYGIHQALSPRMIESLARRYHEAGWGDAWIREGATGAYMLVLHPKAAGPETRGK
jgi:hypothetical protein